eukprot:scaffold15479_cov65-Cyclotella_meneghiniana.AAC.1
MKGGTTLRLEFMVPNGHQKLTFELRVGLILAQAIQPFTPSLWWFGSVDPFHSSLAIPISHCEYNEW